MFERAPASLPILHRFCSIKKLFYLASRFGCVRTCVLILVLVHQIYIKVWWPQRKKTHNTASVNKWIPLLGTECHYNGFLLVFRGFPGVRGLMGGSEGTKIHIYCWLGTFIEFTFHWCNNTLFKNLPLWTDHTVSRSCCFRTQQNCLMSNLFCCNCNKEKVFSAT